MWPVGVTTVPVPVNAAPSAVVAEMPTVAASTWSASDLAGGDSAAPIAPTPSDAIATSHAQAPPTRHISVVIPAMSRALRAARILSRH